MEYAVEYKARCHCGRVRFSFRSPEIKTGCRCDCSLCQRRGAVLSSSYIPAADFTSLNRYRDRTTSEAAFSNHIIRSKWNYQFTRELSLRFIAQYNSTLANPNFTELSTAKNFNTDVLVTWLLNPGTAVYVGYNTNMAYPDPTFTGPGAPPNRFINDARGLFVKASYLFRF